MKKHRKLLAVSMIAAMIIGTVNVAVANKTDETDRKTHTTVAVEESESLEEEQEKSDEEEGGEASSTETEECSEKEEGSSEEECSSEDTEESSAEKKEESSADGEKEAPKEESEESGEAEKESRENASMENADPDIVENKCTCRFPCTKMVIDADCPVCGMEGADIDTCKGVMRKPAKMKAAQEAGEVILNGEPCSTFKEAIDKVNEEIDTPAVIELCQDIDLGTKALTLTINADKDVTIDFRGFTLTGASGSSKGLFTNLGTLTLMDSSGEKGGIYNNGEFRSWVIVNGNKNLSDESGILGTLTLDGIKISTVGQGVYNKTGSMTTISECDISCENGCIENNGIIPVIADTKLSAGRVAIKSQGTDVTQTKIGTITNCTIHGKDGYALQIMSLIETVEDSVLTSGDKAVIQFSAASNKSNPELNCLKNTQVTAEEGDAILAYHGAKLTIESGSYEAASGKLAIIDKSIKEPRPKVSVSGGIFSSVFAESWLADGFVLQQMDDGRYYVSAKEAEHDVEVSAPKLEVGSALVQLPEGVSEEEQKLAEEHAEKVQTELGENEALQEKLPVGLETALKAEELLEAESLPEDAILDIFLQIQLNTVETALVDGKPVIEKLSFDVDPMYTITVGGTLVGNVKKLDSNRFLSQKTNILFHLPVPSGITKRYAKVTHAGTDVSYCELIGTDPHKYIEVQTKSFSPFVVEFTDSKPSFGGSVSNAGVYYADGRGSGAADPSIGTWKQDATGWWFVKADGSYPKNQWYECTWNGKKDWYHFDAEGYMDEGWFKDRDGSIYFLHNVGDNTRGHMYTGICEIDGYSYYFNEQQNGNPYGAMLTGWQWIGGKRYYFNSIDGQDGLPYGAMYQNRENPYGDMLNEKGEWVNGGIVVTKWE